MQHYSILNSFSPIFDENIKILIEILNGKVGETFNIYNYIEAAAAEIVCSNHFATWILEWVNFLLPIIADTTFGVNMKLQQNENKNFLDAVSEYV